MQGKNVVFFGFQMKRFDVFIVFSIVLFVCLSIVQAAPFPKPEEQQKRHCGRTEPCGWAIFNAYTEILDSFQNNLSCDCPPGKKCFRTEDWRRYAYITFRCAQDEGFYE